MRIETKESRRHFLRRGAMLAVTVATAGLASGNVFAETKLAARIAETEQSHPLVPVLRMAARSLEAMESVDDYQATLIKREMVNGKLIQAQMQIKLRQEPMSVYLKFDQPHTGREVIYEKGKNNGNMLVHETGIASLVGALKIDPTGELAMSENRYPISNIGLTNMLTLISERWLLETKLDGVDVKFYPSAKIGDQSAKVVQITYANNTDDVRYHMSRLYIDPQTELPIRLQNYDFPATAGGEPVLIEDYYYSNLKTNVGLKDIDFDTANPAYGF